MKTKQKQKNIPDGWKTESLQDVSKVNMGQSPLSESYNENGVGLPLVQGNADLKNQKTIERVFTTQETKVAEFGDIVLTVRAPVGALGFVDQNRVCIGRGVCAIKNKKDSNQKFIYYFLDSFSNKWKKYEQGSTFTAVNSSDVKGLRIPFPPLPEQNLIVTVLETWDFAIEKLKQKIAIKKEIKKGFMQELLTGKKRLSGFGDKWKEYTLKDIAEFKKGSGISKNQVIDDGKNPCLLYGEIYTKYDELILDVKSYTNTSEGVWSEEGDIFVPASTTTNALDLATATTLIDGKVLVGGDINIIRNKKGLYDPVFLSYYLSHTIKRSIAKYAQGVTIIHLYGNHFKKEKIIIPSRKEQEAIIDIIKKSTKEILTLEKKLQYWQNQKKYLLNNLVTGQIRTPENLLELTSK